MGPRAVSNVVRRVALNQRNRMSQDRANYVETFAHGFGGAGKINDQGPRSNATNPARNHCHGSVLQSFAADGFGQARSFAFDNAQGRFGCVVARAKTGAARGHDQIRIRTIGIDAKFFSERFEIVVYDFLRDDFRAQFGQQLHECGAGLIFALAD